MPTSSTRLVSAPLQSRAARRQHMAELAHAPPVAGSATDAALLRGGVEGPAGGGGVPLHASFPPAGQPDLVRAGQKDEFYVQACSRSRRRWNKAPCECTTHQAVSVCVRQLSQRLRDTLLDVTQRLAGHRRAMAWEEEARHPCPASSRCEPHSARTTNRCLWPARCCTTGSPPPPGRPRWARSTATCTRCIERHTLAVRPCADTPFMCTGHQHRPTARLHAATAAADDTPDGGAVRAAERAVREQANGTRSQTRH